MDFRIDSFLDATLDLLMKLGWKCENDEDFTKLISPKDKGSLVFWLKCHSYAGPKAESALFDIWVQTSYPGGIIREERARHRIRELVKAAELRFQSVSFEQDRAIWFTHKCYEAYFRDEESFLGEAYLFVQGLESFCGFVEFAWQETVRLTQGANLETLREILGSALQQKNFTHEVLSDGSVSVKCTQRNIPGELKISISHLNLISHGGPDFTLQITSCYPGESISLEGKINAKRLLSQHWSNELKLDSSGLKISFQHRFHPYVFSEQDVLMEEVKLLISGIERLFHVSLAIWPEVFVFDPRIQELRNVILLGLNQWDSSLEEEDPIVTESWILGEVKELKLLPDYLKSPPYMNAFIRWLAEEFFNQKAC
jgi:hypothetical protein